MNTPHKHAALIKAWADGAVIQQRYKHAAVPEWITPQIIEWYRSDVEFRVQPAPQPAEPWAEVKAAYRRGEPVQYRFSSEAQWTDALPYKGTDGLGWYPSYEYRIKPVNKWTEVEQEWQQGKSIQYWSRIGDMWMDWKPATRDSKPGFHVEGSEWRIKPVVDPYQEYKDALKAGKTLQYESATTGLWTDGIPMFVRGEPDFGNVQWRIKPHKWQHVIDAHKAGKKVQYRYTPEGVWWEAGDSPSFRENIEWRIAPEFIVTEDRVSLRIVDGKPCTYWIGYSDANVRFTYDKETHKLVSVEVIE